MGFSLDDHERLKVNISPLIKTVLKKMLHSTEVISECTHGLSVSTVIFDIG